MASGSRSLGPEASNALRDWMSLRSERPHTRTGAASKNRIGRLLHFLGLPYHAERQLTERKGGSQAARSVYFTFEVDPQDVDSINGAPQYGSQANGVYHIFCLWEDAQTYRIKQLLNRDIALRGQGGIILLYLNAMTETDRKDLRLMSCTEGLTMAVLDEILLDFLARLDGDRFQAFLESSLPYSAANPYDPDTSWGATVAPEMFYGRQQLTRDITSREGTSIVFGGRQLGKTALLRHAQETFSQPATHHFAWFLDLKAEGYVPLTRFSQGKDPLDIFAILYNNLRSQGIVKDKAITEASEVREELLDAFSRDHQLHVLAMFDESDAFLESDSKVGFPAVESIRALMASTENRFKVVFAGLHNVQRFAQGPNNPFPNLGYNQNSPRRGGIGPLDHREATQLIEEPFRLLGFRFQPLVVDRILSYTNRHPSLIQFFCHALIQDLRSRNANAKPPFMVGTPDVDRVYRLDGIQAGIKNRFEATFQLDPRYHVICLTMILWKDRATQSWTTGEVREHCRVTCELTFNEDNLSNAELESLLQELIGLGILAQDGPAYRIRSALIAQMFGSEGEIEQTLRDLEAREPFDIPTSW